MGIAQLYRAPQGFEPVLGLSWLCSLGAVAQAIPRSARAPAAVSHLVPPAGPTPRAQAAEDRAAGSSCRAAASLSSSRLQAPLGPSARPDRVRGGQ